MAIIDQKLKAQIAGTFSKGLKDEVRIWLFTSKDKAVCEQCENTTTLVRELCEIDPRLKLFEYDIDEHRKEAKVLGVERAPALLLQGAKPAGIYYYGIPSGYEFGSLLEDIIDVSNSRSRLSEKTKEAARSIDADIDIKVFVTPTCPYCPEAVRTAHQIALENSRVRASMIEAMEFSDLAERYGVMGVPKVVINDKVSFEGAVPEDTFIAHINEALA
jgi:glutaredoxin-like protein